MVNESKSVMRSLVLIGGGGHCKSVLDSVLSMNEFEEIVITDAGLEKGSKILQCEVVGTDEVLPELRKKGFDYAFITVGSIKSCKLRVKLSDMAQKMGFIFPVICDPSACVSPNAKIGAGTFVGKNAIINADAEIGEHCIINTGSIIEHECVVGDHTHVSVGSILCGSVNVGKECFIGAGSTLIQGIGVGDRTIIGANSTVLSNVEANSVVYGIVNEQGKKR